MQGACASDDQGQAPQGGDNKKRLDADLEKMGSAGREHVQMHYTIKREAKSLVDFYQSVLHKESSD